VSRKYLKIGVKILSFHKNAIVSGIVENSYGFLTHERIMFRHRPIAKSEKRRRFCGLICAAS
jgi:hypothetical protein